MQTFYSRFLQSVERFPQQIALEFQPAWPAAKIVSVTYAETRSAAETVGSWLRDSGVPPGARCAILAANSPRWVISYLGALSNGCVAVPLDTAFNAEQIRKLLLDSGSAIIFTDLKNSDRVQESIEGSAVRMVLLTGESTGANSLDQILPRGAGDFQSRASSAEDVAVLLYTSGPTSDPKGVMLTHANLDA